MSMVAHVAPVDVPFVRPQLEDIEGLEILDIVDNDTKILLLLDVENEFDFHDFLQKNPKFKGFTVFILCCPLFRRSNI